MITQRDLAMISPPSGEPARARARPPQPSLGPSVVVVAVVLTLRGPCPAPVLDDLAVRVRALLAVGARELVLDLSAVTGADPGLLRAVGDIHRVVAEAGGSLSLTGSAPVGLGTALHAATLAEAFWVYRCLRHPPITHAPVPESGDRGRFPTGSGPP